MTGPRGKRQWDLWKQAVGGTGGEGAQKLAQNRRMLWIVGGLLVLIGLVSDMTYTVGPAEVGVVRHFGRVVAQAGPGLNYRLPWPIQAHNIVNVGGVRRAEIGFRTVEEPGRAARHERVTDEAMMLTGDKNIADVQILVLFQVDDPVSFLFRAEAPEAALRVNAEVALRSVIGEMPIDHAMTVGRPDVEAGTQEFLQSLLDDHQTGLRVVGVELQEVDPPDEVREAFYDVVRAKADRERLIREAEGYARDAIPRARGEAAAIVQAATAYRDQRIALAKGEAERFRRILEEYQKAPEVTRQRLFLEMIERVLPGTEKIIIDPAVGDSLMPFLPLRDLTQPKLVEGE